MEFEKIRKLVYEEYIKNGYEEMWTQEMSIDCKNYQDFLNLAEVGLFGTEVAEAQEAVRKDNWKNLGEECADIVIRVMNFCSRLGIDLEANIIVKNAKNLKREKLHGKKI